MRAAAREDGVDDGFRTRDRRNHNPELYQLSYVHHLFRATPFLSEEGRIANWYARKDSNLQPSA